MCLVASASQAADPLPEAPLPDTWLRYYVHVGPGGVLLDESAEMEAAGTVVPGATVTIKDAFTGIVEIGAFVTPNIAISFTGGFPPTAEIEASGSLNGMGRVGTAIYGPATLTAHYHFTQFGAFQPYIGAGPAFMLAFGEKDGFMNSLDVDNSVGFAVQVGADYMINERWGLFVDVKKAVLRTEAYGYLGGVPVKADVTLDPLVIHSGVTFRF